MAFKIEDLGTKIVLAGCEGDTGCKQHTCQHDSCDEHSHPCPEDTKKLQSCQDDTRHCPDNKTAPSRSAEALSLLQRQLREQLGQGSAEAAL